MTTTPTTDGDETDEDETNDDPSHERRYIPMKDGTTEGRSATLKDACGDGPEDLLSAARLRFLLDSVLLDLYRLWPILYKCNNNSEFWM